MCLSEPTTTTLTDYTLARLGSDRGPIAACIQFSARPVVPDPMARRRGRQWLLAGFGTTAVGLTLLVEALYHVVQLGGLYGGD